MKRNHKVFTVLAFGLAAVALLLGTPITVAAVLAAPFPALGTINTGERVMTDETTGFRVPSVTETLMRIEPHRFPFTQVLDQTTAIPVKQVYHEGYEIGRLPRFVRVNGATTAGASGASVNVTVDSTNAIVVGDVLSAPDNATTTTRQYWVTAVPDSTHVTIKAMPEDTVGTSPYTSPGSFGVVPVLADDEYLPWLDNVKSEGDAVSQPRSQAPVKVWNYLQTQDHNIEFSDHSLLSMNYGQSNWTRTEQEQAAEFRKSREYKMVFHEEAGYFDTTNNRGQVKKHYKQKGLYGFIKATVTLSSTAGNAAITDFLYAVMERGAGRKLLIGGSDFMKVIDKVNVNDNLQTYVDDHFAGLRLVGLRGRMGELTTALHPGFNDTLRADEALVLDMTKIHRLVWSDVELRNRLLKEGQDGIDAEGQYLTVKESLIVMGAGDSTGANACHFKCTLV